MRMLFAALVMAFAAAQAHAQAGGTQATNAASGGMTTGQIAASVAVVAIAVAAVSGGGDDSASSATATGTAVFTTGTQ